EQIKAQLLQVEQHRNRLRTRRKKEGTITVALVGYTNAGKSTLLNFLTQAGVLAENKLFATLDPTSRALKLPNGVSVMLIDTVGFVRRLPHHLVEAFKSTLEEAAFADIIINVCDASNPEFTLHIDVTEKLLSELGCGGKPIITALNKIDVVQEIDFNTLQSNSGFSGDKVKISAKTGFGIDNLLAAVEDNLPVKVYRCKLLLPFSHGGISAEIRKNATLISEEYTDEGLLIEAVLDEPMWQRFKEFEKV
ncbi:MAG: GTPase HflX, partial [Oscillospiraceae bacterium]|nr:GTPase HflX [Oscillospiraceae bacterium]